MRLFVWIGSLLVLALVAALVVPPFFDWNRFRTSFEQQASQVLGQPVKVRGETSARLLPLPSATFSDIRVGDDKEPLLTAESFHVNVELAPLLKGDVVIVDMSLAGPKLNVRIARDGTMDWSLQREGAADLVSADDIAVENITITDGLLRVRDERFERELIIRDIDAEATARTLAGPWRGDARMSYLGQRFELGGSTGRIRPSGTISLNATLKPQKFPYDIAFDGPLSVKGGIPSAVGIVTVKPLIKQSDEDRIAFPRVAAGTALPIKFEGDLEIGSAGASVPAYRMEVGNGEDPYTLIGSGQAVFGEEVSFKAKAEGQQIDIERLRAARETVEDTNGDPKAVSLSDRLALLADVLNRVPRFEAEGDITLNLPAVIAGDTVIRDISLNMQPLDELPGWRLADVSAQLPGRTELRADGMLVLGDDVSWDGGLVLASKQPSGLAKWLAPRVDPAIRKMKGAGFSAEAKIDSTVTELSELEIALDGAKLEGSLRREVAAEGKPKLSTRLSGDRADFDQLAALLRLFSGDSRTGAIAGHDVEFTLDVDELTAAGLAATDVSGTVRVADGLLKVDALSIGNIDGAHVEAAATLEGFPEELTGTASGSIEADNPVPFLQRVSKATGRFSLPTRFADDPALLANAAISFELVADTSHTSLTAAGIAGGSEIDLEFSSDGLNWRIADQTIDSTLILVNDQASQLLQQFGVPVVPGDFGGRSAFRVNVKGKPADGADVQAALTLASGYVSAAGQLTDSLKGSLNLRAEVEDLDTFILLSGLAVPGFGEGLSGEISGSIDLEAGTVRLRDMQGQLAETRFSGALELKGSAGPRPSVKGRLQVDRAALDTIPAVAFAPADKRNVRLLSGLDADLSVAAERLELPDAISRKAGDLENFEARLLVLDGDMVFEDIDSRFADGHLTGRTSLGQTATASTVGGQLTLVGSDARKFAALLAAEPWLEGDTTISGSFESAGENGDALISSLTGSGTVSIRNGILSGIDESAFRSILRAADSLPDDDISGKTADIVKPRIHDGEISFDQAQAAFAVASGVLRASNVGLENEQVALNANMALDLSAGTVKGDATVTYQAGRESVAAATPEVSISIAGGGENRIIETDTASFSTYLGLRLSERKQREFEAQKASILERQRLLRTARLYELKEEKRRLLRAEQERIEQLRRKEEERRRIEQIRRVREALEQAKLEAELRAVEQQAETEAAAEAGRRAKRKEQIEQLRRRAEQEAERRKGATDADLLDFDKLVDG